MHTDVLHDPIWSGPSAHVEWIADLVGAMVAAGTGRPPPLTRVEIDTGPRWRRP